MAKTETDLIRRTLQLLQKIGTGQEPAAEDVALIQPLIEPKVADLSARNVIFIDDTDDIEPATFEWLAILMTQVVAADYGTVIDPNAIKYAESRLAHIRSRLDSARDRGGVVRAEYF